MNHRYLKLHALETIAADKTLTIDLDMQDPISQLLIDSRVTNGAGADSTEHPMASITNIEIIDGSEVLWGLDGFETEALDIYHAGMHPRGGWFNYLVTTVTDRMVALNFGRFLWDEVLAFDPKRFKNPQLRITFDISAGGMSPSNCLVAVYAALFDQKVISPTGFLMAKEVKRYTTVAAQHEYTDLPTDYPYRKLLVMNRKADSPPHWMLANIKLAEDQDKKIVVDNDFRSLIMGIGRENAFVREVLTAGGAAAPTSGHCTPTMDVMGVASQWRNDTDGGDIATYNGDGGYYQWWCELVQNTVHHIDGWAPHGCVQIPFGRQDDPADWYDVRGIGNLKLDITDGVADGTTKIFLQQYRMY